MTIGNLIENQLNRLEWNKTEFAKQLGITRNGLYGILNRSSIDTELIFRICTLLNYDFFRAYSIRFVNRSGNLGTPPIEYELNQDVDIEIKMRMPKHLVKEMGLNNFISKHNEDVKFGIE